MAVLEVGALASHFTLLGSDGREYHYPRHFQGRPGVLVFFKTGCGACDLAFPYLASLREAYPEGWELWAIAQDPPEKARDYARRHGATFPVLIDAPAYDVSRLYDPPATPTLFVVGPEGRVAYTSWGFAKEDLNEISARIAAFLGVPAAEIAPEGDGRPDFRPG